jgi:Ala-tRNA(Pro) deacylase
MPDSPDPARQAPAPTLPTTPEQLLARLAELGIACRTVSHPPVFTVEEAKALRGELPGGHVKNLFLRDKKGAMWLVVAEEDRRIDLKALAARIGAGKVSFASAARLMAYLGWCRGRDALRADQRQGTGSAGGDRCRAAGP